MKNHPSGSFRFRFSSEPSPWQSEKGGEPPSPHPASGSAQQLFRAKVLTAAMLTIAVTGEWTIYKWRRKCNLFMKYEWIDAYCLAKAGAEKDFKLEWNATRYMIRGKLFAMQGGDKERKSIITIKLEPALGSLLRNQYKDIVPGYYMNKEHWNSLYLDGDVPDEIVKEMLDQAHQIVLHSFSQKIQKEISG
jgi:predicted DNA-binding protein (MmcQ/YjbR family)